jgi:hypothetical protein
MNRKLLGTIVPGLLVAAGLLLAACSPTLGPTGTGDVSPLGTPGFQGGQPGATVSPTVQPPEATAGPTAAPAELPEGSQQLVEQVKQDLAQRLNVPIDDISVVSVRAMEWPSSALGCPEPGTMYLDVITPGFEIILEANGQQYAYHTGRSDFVLCERPQEVAPTAIVTATASSQDPATAPLVELARKDLATRLNVPVESISLISITAVQWRDSSLGCPEPGMGYATVITPGYLIMLEANGQEYEYHASRTQVVTCENPQAPLSPE